VVAVLQDAIEGGPLGGGGGGPSRGGDNGPLGDQNPKPYIVRL